MQAGIACIWHQVSGIMYRNICGLEVPKSHEATPPKMAENNRAKFLWDFRFWTDKQLLSSQPDIVVVDKEQRRAVVIDVGIPSDSTIREKEHKNLEKHQALKAQLDQMWKVRAKVVPVVTGVLAAVAPDWKSGSSRECSPRNTKYCTEPSNSLASGRGPEPEEDTHHPMHTYTVHFLLELLFTDSLKIPDSEIWGPYLSN